MSAREGISMGWDYEKSLNKELKLFGIRPSILYLCLEINGLQRGFDGKKWRSDRIMLSQSGKVCRLPL